MYIMDMFYLYEYGRPNYDMGVAHVCMFRRMMDCILSSAMRVTWDE